MSINFYETFVLKWSSTLATGNRKSLEFFILIKSYFNSYTFLLRDFWVYAKFELIYFQLSLIDVIPQNTLLSTLVQNYSNDPILDSI